VLPFRDLLINNNNNNQIQKDIIACAEQRKRRKLDGDTDVVEELLNRDCRGRD